MDSARYRTKQSFWNKVCIVTQIWVARPCWWVVTTQQKNNFCKFLLKKIGTMEHLQNTTSLVRQSAGWQGSTDTYLLYLELKAWKHTCTETYNHFKGQYLTGSSPRLVSGPPYAPPLKVSMETLGDCCSIDFFHHGNQQMVSKQWKQNEQQTENINIDLKSLFIHPYELPKPNQLSTLHCR